MRPWNVPPHDKSVRLTSDFAVGFRGRLPVHNYGARFVLFAHYGHIFRGRAGDCEGDEETNDCFAQTRISLSVWINPSMYWYICGGLSAHDLHLLVFVCAWLCRHYPLAHFFDKTPGWAEMKTSFPLLLERNTSLSLKEISLLAQFSMR